MNTENSHQISTTQKKGGCLKTGLIVLATIVISVVATIFVINNYIFPKQFKPVALNKTEEITLDEKLKRFGLPNLVSDKVKNKSSAPALGGESPTKKLEPLPYTEVGAKREVSFTERELNAILANNTDFADKVAIDLADNLASANVIMPIDPDFPFFGGKTLKANAGLEINFNDEKPIIILKGVSLWGVPMPNAWLGNLKNVDLIKEFGNDEGFWKSFAAGIDNIEVKEGNLQIKLKE